jgi:hypothetical protein
MAQFTIKGTIRGDVYAVTWQDGRLSGDPFAVDLLQARAYALDDLPVGPMGGPYTGRDHLAIALSSVFIIRGVFDEILEYSDDEPPLPPVSDDTVL